jgi:hypothetical protein
MFLFKRCHVLVAASSFAEIIRLFLGVGVDTSLAHFPKPLSSMRAGVKFDLLDRAGRPGDA